ncbi:hypothetical protein CRENBAI_015984 [Crenichthys baileyi]|uniref:Uncharacterized protein n=1 Tax=Crenichthys baileyi TaxID=28760 RepID=A0AAV9RXY2_9TELE
MEGCFGKTDWADMDFEPGRNRSSPARSSSKRRHPRRKRSTPAAAALGRPRHAHSSCASAHGCSGSNCNRVSSWVTTQSLWVVTQRPLQFSGRRCSLQFLQGPKLAEFLAEGWLDAPAPASAGGPFDPLLVAIKAALSPKDPAAMVQDPQHAAKSSEPQSAAAGSSESQPAGASSPRHVPEEPVGGLPPIPRLFPEEPEDGLPPRPGPEHLLGFLWGVLTELMSVSRPDAQHDTPQPDAQHDTPQPESRPDTPQPDTRPDTPQPDTRPDTPQPDTRPDTPQPDTRPDTPQPDTRPDTLRRRRDPQTLLWQMKVWACLLQPSRQLAGKPPPRQPTGC